MVPSLPCWPSLYINLLLLFIRVLPEGKASYQLNDVPTPNILLLVSTRLSFSSGCLFTVEIFYARSPPPLYINQRRPAVPVRRRNFFAEAQRSPPWPERQHREQEHPRSENPLRLEFCRYTYQTWREREPQVPSSWGLPGRERMKWAHWRWQSMLQVKMLKRGNVQE